MENISKSKTLEQDIEPFVKTDERPATSRTDLLDEFDSLLANRRFDNKMSKKYLGRVRAPRLIGGIGGAALCVAAVVLVLMPATAHEGTLRYILAGGMLVGGAYIAVKFAL
ncbi:MAG: hypothetical protein JSU01_21875 [Bacteroidetes bacterium]|nr:hypothetical protein [Bacteroidota bacterium]